MKFLLILIMLILSGCEKPEKPLIHHPESVEIWNGDLYFSRDDETGCEYLRVSGGSTIYPRMSADGKQICRGGK